MPTNEFDLYHASLELYEPGQVVQALGGSTRFAARVEERGMKWVDDLLDKYRPLEAPRRVEAMFASASLELCAAYASAESHCGTWHLYKVTMERPFPGVFCIADAIRLEGSITDRAQHLAQEYWNQKQKWHTVEFLDYSFCVSELLEIPPDELFMKEQVGLLQATYDGDLLKALPIGWRCT